MTRKNSSKSVKPVKTAVDASTGLYIRVSTQLQAEEGFSLAAQTERLNAYCVAQGWTVTATYTDAGISGKTTDRPAFQAMLEAAQAGQIKRIVAMKLDRVARNVREFLATVDELKDYGCDLVLVKESFDTSTPHGRFALTMFAAMAELEASTITERVMSGKEQNSKEGGYNGARIPLGYSYSNGVFSVIDSEAITVNRIFTLFNAGQSLRSIARTLSESGAQTKAGGKWHPETIAIILRNCAYAGLSEWNNIKAATSEYPAIISKEVYEQAHKRLQALRPGKQLESEIARRLQAPDAFLT
jgi:site-specific DNA recombinase